MKQYILDSGTHQFATDKTYINKVLSIGKSAMKGKFAIIGVEKSKVVQFLNEPHGNKVELDKAVAEYVELGFRVYTS